MKPFYFLFLILLCSCGKASIDKVEIEWRDSLVAENAKLKRESDSLQKMLGLDCFMGALISFKDEYKLNDTVKFQFFPAYTKPGIADYFHYTIVDHNPYNPSDVNDLRPLDSLQYNDSIGINTNPIGTEYRNLISITNCPKGTNYLVGYFTMFYKNKTPSRFYCTSRFTVK